MSLSSTPCSGGLELEWGENTHVLTLTGREGDSWHSGERLVHGSWLYWLVFSARAAIWLVRLGCRARAPPCTGAGAGLGECWASWGWEGGAGSRDTPTPLTLGHRGEEGTFLQHRDRLCTAAIMQFRFFRPTPPHISLESLRWEGLKLKNRSCIQR